MGTVACYVCGNQCSDKEYQNYLGNTDIAVLCLSCATNVLPTVAPSLLPHDGQCYTLNLYKPQIEAYRKLLNMSGKTGCSSCPSSCPSKAACSSATSAKKNEDDYLCLCGRKCNSKTETKCWWCEAPIGKK
jgi:hypothetical protein